jgi:D-alanyl-D-alanine carboxypeptidase
MTHPASALPVARRTRPPLLAGVAGTALLGVLGFPSLAGWSSIPASSASSADGVVVPDGITVDHDEYPAVSKLDPALLGALRRAAADAANDGVVLHVNSGWRSPEYQEKLLDDAVTEYGSREEAARWVATPTTSAHVSGDAVDIGHAEATAWLSEHGAAYSLCQIYANEPWHYELRPHAVASGCPEPYTDPTQDRRMQPSA